MTTPIQSPKPEDVEAAKPVDEHLVNRVAVAAMIYVTPHLKHMISFSNLWVAVRDALAAQDKGSEG